MINIICTIIGTGVVVGGAVGAILKGFYKTNKESNTDHDLIEERFDKKIHELENKFDDKLNRLEDKLENKIKDDDRDFRKEIEKICSKIDEMKTHYVSNENFKTYAETMSQLLQMSTDRMTRIENTLDDIRDDLNQIARLHNNQN